MAKQYIFTPFLSVIAAHCLKEDKPYKPTDKPKFKIRFDATAEQIKEFQAALMTKAGNPKFDIPDPQIGVSVSKKGVVTICPASLYRPALFDCANNKLNEPKIGPGTIARAYCQINAHNEGIGLQLVGVQIKKLEEYAGGGGSSPFDTAEGYVADEVSPFTEAPAATPAASGTSALDI